MKQLGLEITLACLAGLVSRPCNAGGPADHSHLLPSTVLLAQAAPGTRPAGAPPPFRRMTAKSEGSIWPRRKKVRTDGTESKSPNRKRRLCRLHFGPPPRR